MVAFYSQRAGESGSSGIPPAFVASPHGWTMMVPPLPSCSIVVWPPEPTVLISVQPPVPSAPPTRMSSRI
ncbi:hypothetical protein AHiyo8_02270 [Arthrobacter sp. Hiyo8]|nr:hypothetical protein AHiyo8_02270 [Arthrobacter sp. Hiyo8]